MWALKLLLIPLFLYLAVLAAIYFAQTSLLFPARMVQPMPPLAGSNRLSITTPDRVRLEGVHLPAAAPRSERLTILGFGGNAWNGESVAEYLHDIFPEADVVAFHYRGYLPSDGAPSAAALLADAPLIHDHVAERLGNERIVAVGFSIGSGVAAHLASRRKLAGAILVTPFDSLTEVARGHYPWLPVRLLLRHRMDAAADLAASPVPIALIAAERDTLIPPARAQALASATGTLVLHHTIAGVGHNDIYQHPAFRTAMHDALQRIESTNR